LTQCTSAASPTATSHEPATITAGAAGGAGPAFRQCHILPTANHLRSRLLGGEHGETGGEHPAERTRVRRCVTRPPHTLAVGVLRQRVPGGIVDIPLNWTRQPIDQLELLRIRLIDEPLHLGGAGCGGDDSRARRIIAGRRDGTGASRGLPALGDTSPKRLLIHVWSRGFVWNRPGTFDWRLAWWGFHLEALFRWRLNGSYFLRGRGRIHRPTHRRLHLFTRWGVRRTNVEVLRVQQRDAVRRAHDRFRRPWRGLHWPWAGAREPPIPVDSETR